MTSTRLAESVSVTLDNSGNGTVSLGPQSAREVWHPKNVHVRVSTAINESTCAIFVGDAPQQRCFRDQTFTGSSGDSSDRINADDIQVGSKLWAVWSGGDAHAEASLSVTGRKSV